MTVGTGKLKEPFINSDLAYALWLTSGSITRATKRLADEGIRNPLTGNPACRMGIWSAASKSEYYKKFVEDRKSGKIASSVPTDEEFAKARELIDELLKVEVEKNKVAIVEYGRVHGK